MLRGQKVLVARDNVLFEAGLFLSKLGRKRTFLVVPAKSSSSPLEFHLPTDLNGLTMVKYRVPNSKDKNELTSNVQQACITIRKAMEEQGVRKNEETQRLLEVVTGGLIFILRFLEKRKRERLANLHKVLVDFNSALDLEDEEYFDAGWEKAAQYAVQTLTFCHLVELSKNGLVSISKKGRDFLSDKEVKSKFKTDFKRELPQTGHP